MRIKAAIAAMGIVGMIMMLVLRLSNAENAKSMLEVIQTGTATFNTYAWLVLPVLAAGAVFAPFKWLPMIFAGANVILHGYSIIQIMRAGQMLPNGNAFAFLGLYSALFWFLMAWMVVLLGLTVYYWKMTPLDE